MGGGIFLRKIGRLLLLGGCILAQDEPFQVRVSKERVSVGEPFKITFTATAKVSKFTPPEFPEGLSVISGPNQSTEFSIINGEISYRWSVSFVLRAEREGTYEIGSATAVIDGKEYETEPLKIIVEKGAGGISGGSTHGTGPQSGNTQAQQARQTPAIEAKGDIFLRAVASKESVYPGEPVVITYYLYTRHNLLSMQIEKTPGIENAWVEEKRMGQNVQLMPTIVDGRQFYFTPVREVVVYPRKSGILECAPLELKVVARIPIRREPQSIFDMFFGSVFYENSEVSLKSNAIKIRVRDFPTPPPQNFSGFSGRLSLKWSISSDTPHVNDAVTLKITLAGEGNMKILNIPDIEMPSFVEAYPPRVKDDINMGKDGLYGDRTWEIIFIPRKEGTFTLKGFSLSYFNLATQKFEFLNMPDITISVKGISQGTQTPAPVAQVYTPGEKVRYMGEDIRDIKRRMPILHNILFMNVPLWAYPAAFLPLILSFAVVMLAGKKRKLTRRDVCQSALKELKRILKEEARKRDSLTESYTRIQNAIFKYLGTVLEKDPQYITTAAIKETLIEKGAPAEAINTLTDAMQEIELELFAPGLAGNNPTRKKPLIKSITSAIEKIHEHLLKETTA